MNPAGSVEGHERPRLFYGLPLPGSVVGALASWQHDVFEGLPDLRVVSGEQLHVTLAFLGSRPRTELPALRAALREAARDCPRPELTLAHYRETERVGMFVFDDTDGRAERLERRLVGRLEALGIARRERRRWVPHVTVARFRRRPRLRPQLPELGAVYPSDAALYHSVLRPDGAQYFIVEAVVLGGR